MGGRMIERCETNYLAGRLRLAKIWLCLLVGLSTLFGYLMAAGSFSVAGLLLGGGVFLLASGGATLNSWQERLLDRRMQRTRSRPMARGEFSASQALTQAVLLVAGGFWLISGAASVSAACFALGGLLIYNFVYTPLKTKSLFALFPGAVCGAVPPCVGWIGGGGWLNAYNFWLLFGLFFLWQIPHFWLVMLKHRNDYIGGPYPSLLDRFPDTIVKGFFLPWLGSLLVVMMLFPLVAGQGLVWVRWGIILNCLLLGGLFVFQLGGKSRPDYTVLFMALNLALIFHMAIVTLALLMQG